MSIKNLTMFLILAQNWSQLISTQRWHSTIRVNLTLKRSETLSRQFIVNSHGGIKAAAFLTEMIRRMEFLTTFLWHTKFLELSPVSPTPARAVFIKCHDWSDCYWSLCPHPWLVEPGTSSSLIATGHYSVLQVTSQRSLSNLRASSHWFNSLFGKITYSVK